MKKVLIKNGLLLSSINGYSYTKKDILIEDGKIKQIADVLDINVHVIDVKGSIISPGFIDIHTHCFPLTPLGLGPDRIGVDAGVTTILDAGSSGAQTYEKFKEDVIDKCKTKVFTLLNVSTEGLLNKHELDDMNKIDEYKIDEIIHKYKDNIVGFKARASASVVMDMGIKPIYLAADIAHRYKLPLMVHIGNYPPSLKDVLNIVDKDDVITHTYHGKDGGMLEGGNIIEEAIAARERGVKFDVGHGSASFSFRVYKQMKETFNCDFISTDLHVENINGPVYSLAAVMTKLLNCGEPLTDIIDKVTSAPAKHFHLDGLGELREGCIGDITIFHLQDCDKEVKDSSKDTLHVASVVVIDKVIRSKGDQSELFEYDA